MYKIVTDLKEKEWLLGKYSYNIKLRSLKEFSKKHGYGDDFMGIHFKEYLEEDPYEFQQELSKIKDRQVLLIVDYPATISDDKNAEEVAYIDFDKFYNYLAEIVDKRIIESPDDKEEYEQLLAKVKTALEV